MDFGFTYRAKKLAYKVHVEKIWGPWDDTWQTGEHRKDFSEGKSEIIVVDGVDAGYTYIRRTPESIHLIDICILPEHQSKGIGTHIIKSLLNEAKAQNIPVELGAFKINQAAIKLYKSLGFTQTAETPTHVLLRSR